MRLQWRVARVLIVEEGWAQTIPLAHALEASGHAVTVVTANGGHAAYTQGAVHWRGCPAADHPELVPALDRLVRDRGFDHVLPMTEAVMARLWQARPAWSPRIYPATDAFQRALLGDKRSMVEHMAAHGMPVPRRAALADAAALGYPLVVKGATGAGGARVRIVEAAGQLAAVLREVDALGGAWSVQELIRGPTYLFGGLFDGGRPLRIYAGEKLAQHPPRTGPAVRLRSDDDPALLALGLRVMRALRWTGFASADFVRAPDGRYVFLEVNPRLWGSIAAARAAGVDLFAPFAALLAGRAPAPDLAFVANQDCHIFPRYLLSPSYWRPAGALRAIRDLLGAPGRDWRDVAAVRHAVNRLRRPR